MSNVHPPSSRERARQHEEVWKALPWYFNQTLSTEERERVEHHLETCAECQEELIRCGEVDAAVEVDRESDWQPSEADLDRMLHKIGTQRDEAPRETPPHTGLVGIWPQLPVVIRGLVTGQALAIAGLAGLLIWSFAAPSTNPSVRDVDRIGGDRAGDRFETLTTPSGSSSPGPRIQIVFADGVTEIDLRELLSNVDGSIVSGPSKQGLYEIVLGRSPEHVDRAEPDATRSLAEVEQAVERLRRDDRIRFVAPVQRGSTP